MAKQLGSELFDSKPGPLSPPARPQPLPQLLSTGMLQAWFFPTAWEGRSLAPHVGFRGQRIACVSRMQGPAHPRKYEILPRQKLQASDAYLNLQLAQA